MTDRSTGPAPLRAPPSIVRVLPDVSGLDKEFDYLVPADLAASVAVGSMVRIPLHGRRVVGWVIEVDPVDHPVPVERLVPLLAVVSAGPDDQLIDLARWASIRWAAGRLRPFLVTASPAVRVRALPRARRTPADRRAEAVVSAGPVAAAAATALGAQNGSSMLVIPPAASPVGAILAATALGPTLVVVPSVSRADAMGEALRKRGVSVAVVPHDSAAAAAGVDVVIGARAAAWAPCPGLAAAVVVDEHDESLQEERNPTWHARDVVIERVRRVGGRVLLTSPCPSVAGVAAVHDRLSRVDAATNRDGWPVVDIVDRTDEEPWKTSLVTSALITELRRGDRTVVCVHNTTGRGAVLSCRTCRALVRCERCDAAVGLDDDGQLACRRCHTVRPPVCQACGASKFANLRPGITRLREELEAAAGRAVTAVSARGEIDSTVIRAADTAPVYVGTEAVLHRVARADVVAFLDIDRELLAPRYRATEQALALLVRGARLVGPRRRGGRLLVQTFLPDDPVLRSVVIADATRVLSAERARRELLGLPPFRALALVEGDGAPDVAAHLRRVEGLSVGADGDRFLVRGVDPDELGWELLAARAAAGTRTRLVVDPPRV